MQLIATYSFFYGRKGPRDCEHPLVRKGETFTALATSQASAAEVGRHLISNGVALDPAKKQKEAKL